MLDLLASKGAIEILRFLENNPNVAATDILDHFQETLTRATIYRRLKELEVAGFLTRESYTSKRYILSSKGDAILKERVKNQEELIQLKRTRRTLLREIKGKEDLNVAELYEQVPLSPNTISQALTELRSLGLITQVEEEERKEEEKIKVDHYLGRRKGKKLRPGRPKKKHKLTKKGEVVYQQHMQMENEEQ